MSHPAMTVRGLRAADVPRSPVAAPEPTVVVMDDGRPAVLIAWIECEVCGRIDKSPHEFNYPADMAADTHLWVRLPCEQCRRQAKLHLKRELKPLQ
jgi:hypothetical protein